MDPVDSWKEFKHGKNLKDAAWLQYFRFNTELNKTKCLICVNNTFDGSGILSVISVLNTNNILKIFKLE